MAARASRPSRGGRRVRRPDVVRRYAIDAFEHVVAVRERGDRDASERATVPADDERIRTGVADGPDLAPDLEDI